MAKLINILAASVGGGLMLGAGIRLGEALAGRDSPQGRDHEQGGILATRLGAIEERLNHLESARNSTAPEGIPATGSSMAEQTAEVEAKLEALGETTLRLRSELKSWLESSVTTRMAEVESRLKAESEATQKQLLDGLVDGVQARVMNRIGKLEEELASQSAAMTDLRECSIRTEQSMQKLLGGLDRLITAQRPASADAEKEKPLIAGGQETSGEPELINNHSAANGVEGVQPVPESQPLVESQSAGEARPRPRRWAIFG